MYTLAEIEVELVSIRAHARNFKTIEGALFCKGVPATAAEADALRAGIARFELLVRAANRMQPI